MYPATSSSLLRTVERVILHAEEGALPVTRTTVEVYLFKEDDWNSSVNLLNGWPRHGGIGDPVLVKATLQGTLVSADLDRSWLAMLPLSSPKLYRGDLRCVQKLTRVEKRTEWKPVDAHASLIASLQIGPWYIESVESYTAAEAGGIRGFVGESTSQDRGFKAVSFRYVEGKDIYNLKYYKFTLWREE
jgi:hypothetical protein